MLEALQRMILNRYVPASSDAPTGPASSNLLPKLGRAWVATLRGKTVADFGCGHGVECEELAAIAGRVVGVDSEPKARAIATVRTSHLSNVRITDHLDEPVDAIISIDAFEHFSDPAAILAAMVKALRPGGCVLVSFGPTWYHPLGGHLFSVFPWAHLLFSEQALMRWRAQHRTDGARRFGEVEGGLNRMTIRNFKALCDASGLDVAHFEAVPISSLRALHSPLTEEFTTALVRAYLVKRE